MLLKIKLAIECHSANNIFFLCEDGLIPVREIDECPRKASLNLLSGLTGYDVSEENSWLTTELVGTEYKEDEKAVYILYICRVPEKLDVKLPLEWVELNKISEQIESIKGLF